MNQISSQQCVLKMAWTAGFAVLSSIRQSPPSDQKAVVSLREQYQDQYCLTIFINGLVDGTDFTLIMLADDTQCSGSSQSARGRGCCSEKLSDRNPMQVSTKSCICEVTVEAEAHQLGSSSAVKALGALGCTRLAPRQQYTQA